MSGCSDTMVLVLGTADWNASLATNQHYVVRELTEQFPVLFVESMGLRRPKASRQDAQRVLSRLTSRLQHDGLRPVPARLSIAGPRLLPWHTGLTRGVNGAALRVAVRPWLSHVGRRALWTYTPITYGLENDADLVVYHLVDLLHENPNAYRQAILRNERRLASRADLALGSSPAVVSHLRRQAFPHVYLRPNVADIAVFLDAGSSIGRGSVGDRPFVVFGGNITPMKVDLEVIEKLVEMLDGEAEVRLVGPVGLGPGGGSPAWLARLRASGATLVPPMPLPQLAEEFAAARVGLVPYEVTDLTMGVDPLKRYEYLAAGIPVVSTPLPAMVPVAGSVFVEPDPTSFARRVRELVRADPAAARQRHQALALKHGWRERGAEYRALVATGMPGGHRIR